MRIALSACVLFAATCVTACASAPGRLEANRFQHNSYPYALFYVPSGGPEYPLGPHYTLENFYSPDGHHRHPRLGGEFSIDRSYRDEDPGVVGSESFYDLLFSRDDPKARFWVRSVPLKKADAGVPLAALAQRYLDAVKESGRAAAPFGLEKAAKAAPVQLRNVVTSAPCELSKREALRMDFELENKGAMRTLDEPEWRSVSVILVRTGYVARAHYPVLMLVGRESDRPADESLNRDFDRMLSLLALGDKGQGLTMKGDFTCGPASGLPPANEAIGGGAETSGGERTPELEVPIIQEDAPINDTP